MKSEGEWRDWKPGDGMRCRFAKMAPLELPCGPPVRTHVQSQSIAGRATRTVVNPLCKNHADLGALPPSTVVARARRTATERLISEHWDQFDKYLHEAIADAQQSGESS